MKTKHLLHCSIALTTATLWIFSGSVTHAKTKQTPHSKKGLVANTPTAIIKAEHGAKMKFAYKDLADHEMLEVSFLLHIVGPWDGTRYPKWGPDRMIVSIDNSTRLLDATFNNCHLLFIDNVWQTYPDPYQSQQGIGLNYRRMLQFGGTGAERIASMGFASNRHKSVDSTYRFHFLVKHATPNAELSFFANWVEDASPSTYWVENLQIKPIAQVAPLNKHTEEKAWQTILSSDAKAAQQAWSTVYTAHPECYIKRVQSLVTTDQTRRKWLIKKISQGPVPGESLIRPVILPTQKNTQEIRQRIALLRELALSHDAFSETSRYIRPKEFTPTAQVIRLACFSNKGLETRRIKMRVAGYLRMIHTKEALSLLKKFNQPSPHTQWSADCEDPPEETVQPD